MTSFGNLITDIGLSEIDAMVGQNISVGQVGPSRLPAGSVNVEMPPPEGLTVQEKFPQRLKLHPGRSAKTFLKDFEINPPTMLDPEHNTINLSKDEVMQFARAFSLQVILTSYGLVEDLLLPVRSAGTLGILTAAWVFPFSKCCCVCSRRQCGFSDKVLAANSFLFYAPVCE